jgi:hypothetical protein
LARIPTEFVAVVGAALIIGIALHEVSNKDQPTTTPKAATLAPPVSAPAKTTVEAVIADTITPTEPVVKPAVKPPVRSNQSTRNTTRVEPAPFTTTSPLAYRILHGGDQVLYDIAAIADDSNGRLVDVHGKLFTPHSLNEARSFSQLFLITPKITASEAHKKLTTRSGMSPYPLEGPKPPLAEGEVVFLIEAQL